MLRDLKKTAALKSFVAGALYGKTKFISLYPDDVATSTKASSVLFLLGRTCNNRSADNEPCVIFNKRSLKVRQPGDLCFPGGRVSPRLDLFLSKLLSRPFLPLGRWAYWRRWQEKGPEESDRLSLLFATSLRESFEEMRLNPLGVTFLGPMPCHELPMFRRELYPMVVWVNRQMRFFPNWEVEKIVRVPLGRLLESHAYALYRLRFHDPWQGMFSQDFPCFQYEDGKGKEILWGVTYRIVMAFIKMIFDFNPPSLERLPVIKGSMNRDYFNGSGNHTFQKVLRRDYGNRGHEPDA